MAAQIEQRRETGDTQRDTDRPGAPGSPVRVVDNNAHIGASVTVQPLPQRLTGLIRVERQTQHILRFAFRLRPDVRAIHTRVGADEPQPMLYDQRIEPHAQDFFRFGQDDFDKTRVFLSDRRQFKRARGRSNLGQIQFPPLGL